MSGVIRSRLWACDKPSEDNFTYNIPKTFSCASRAPVLLKNNFKIRRGGGGTRRPNSPPQFHVTAVRGDRRVTRLNYLCESAKTLNCVGSRRIARDRKNSVQRKMLKNIKKTTNQKRFRKNYNNNKYRPQIVHFSHAIRCKKDMCE